jgi:FAD/FMN-containing dehydrogenase
MSETTLEHGDIGALRESFGGSVLLEGDAGYEDARGVFNSMVEKRPAIIAQCGAVSDVKAALAFARDAGLEVAIRSGGHSVAGAGLTEGGLVIDMRPMSSVSIDPDARTATVGGGTNWGQLDGAAGEHGLMTPGGRVSTTGVAGLTLGGGSCWLERKFGFACDNLLSVRLVTAGGEEVAASEDENPELFWALHGGGGNFGVATELTFRLHPLPEATLALLAFDPEAAPEVARAYRDMIDDGAPDELGGGLAYITGPPEPFIPESLQGKLLFGVLGIYAGGEADAREALAPIAEHGPSGEMFAAMPYPAVNGALDDPPGYRNYWSAEHLSELPDEAVDLFCARAADMVVPSPSQHIMIPWGAAVGGGADEWPLPHRAARWVAHPLGLWEDPADDEQAIGWARGFCADMKPFATGAVYLNFTGEEGEDRIVAGYGRENYDRLAKVKAEFDPQNVFHLNHGITPAA